jgi:hypothetical protein
MQDFDSTLLGLCFTDSSAGDKTCELNISKQAGATIDSASALFYKNRLLAVILFTSGYQNFAELLDAMEAAYGRGYQANKYIDEYFWQTDLTTRILHYNKFSKKVTATLVSKKLTKERESDRLSRAKEGIKDF